MTHFSWGELVFGPLFAHLFSAGAAALVICVLVMTAGKALLKARGEEGPAQKLSLRGLMEFFTSFIVGMSDSVIGPEGRKLVPLFGALFLIIWVHNVLALLPGFSAATGNLNATFALGIGSFVLYNYYGIRHHGWGYIRQFLGPLLLIAPFMFILEVISHIMRPVSLAFRLYGNMLGDHTVLSAFVDMAPFLIPVVFYFLGLFVCTMQAFVFTMLSMVYFSMAVAEEH